MQNKWLNTSKGGKFYSPGQEIKIGKDFVFRRFTCEKDFVSVCKSRLFLGILLFSCLYIIIILRLFNIGFASFSTFPKKHTATAVAPTKRADIVDRNGNIVATTVPIAHLVARPNLMINPNEAAKQIANILPDLSEQKILQKLAKYPTFVYLKKNITPKQQYDINALGLPGIDFENSKKRVYPHQNLLSHIVGITNIDNLGISGVEAALNERLTSSDIAVKLSLDTGLQDTVRYHLRRAVKQYKAVGATAILTEANSGKILSLVSIPDFDPNKPAPKNERAMYNFAASGVYEAGSVFKVFNTALGLESGKIKMRDSFDATKPIKVGGRRISDFHGENRWLTVPEILTYSSNIGSAQIALKVGKEEQQEFMQKLGFFDSINIEVAEKNRPIVPKHWYESTIATVSYGYGISVSALHIVSAFASMVNGGIYYSPTILDSSATPQGKRVISYGTSEKIRDMIRDVVVEGSGKGANVAGYEVAGKTGTAMKIENGKYVEKKVITTFVATFPVSNPQYVLLVTLDEPKPDNPYNFNAAGWNVAPTANNIISEIAPQLNLKPNNEVDKKRSLLIEAAFEK